MATLTLTAAATAAAQFLMVIDPGEGLSTQQITDALAVANDLLDNWSSDQLFVPAVTLTTKTVTQNFQGPYALGFSALAIEAAAFTNSGGPGGPLEVCDAEKWSRIPDRESASYILKYLFFDRQTTSHFYVSPLPQGSSLSVELTTWAALTQFADATTAITMLPGYALPFKLALALVLAPQYDVEPSKTLIANAQEAIARIRQLNAQLLPAPPPPAPGQ